ncbi:MAG: methyltransferase domain-containing protein [Clostridiales bacterium]|nr:methyltransferase domain-containing protein [Clostridiales bacterium]
MENIVFKELAQDKEVRQRLITLKSMQKDEKNREAVNGAICQQWRELSGLLNHEDAKVRKNAALLLGEAGVQDSVDALGQAYVSENILFVRPAYLTALGQLDYRKYTDVFEKRLEELNQMEILVSESKHLNEERHLLSELLDLAGGSGHHEFSKKISSKVILAVRRGMEAIVYEELKSCFPKSSFKKMNGGIMAETGNVEGLFKVRTWQTILFVFCKKNGFAKDGAQIAQGIMDSDPLSYLSLRHAGQGIWRFRVDVRTHDDGAQKAALAKKTAFALEALGGGQFLNSISDYEIEFVLMEGKDGRIFAYLRLHTLKDHRFDYRKNFIAASMNPVSAAQMIAVCRPYFKENANVLDPFCGVGTLLIERKLWGDSYPEKRIRALYGLDIFKTAVDFGRENAAHKNCRVNFIQRDFFDFSHGYLFDEIITDTPENFKSEPDRKAFFERFLKKATDHLAPWGRIFIFTRSAPAIREALRNTEGFETLLCRPFSEKSKSWIMILQASRKQ